MTVPGGGTSRDPALDHFVARLCADRPAQPSSGVNSDHAPATTDPWERLWLDMGRAATLPTAAPTPPVTAVVLRPARWRPTRTGAGLAIAAGVLLTLTVNPLAPPRPHVETTDSRRVVRLADGSRLWLDARTAVALRYGPATRRLVLLRGRIGVAVAPDPARPFTVESGKGAVTALGTRFVVARDGADTDVIVTEHRVRVSLADGRTAIVPEGFARRYGPLGTGALRRAGGDMATAWTRGWLRFDDRPLGQVVSELSRYRSGWITLAGSGLGKRRVSGMIALDDRDRALESLQAASGLRSTRIGSAIIVLHR